MTLTFEGAVDQFNIGIGEWNGPSTFAPNYGISAIDYQSGVETVMAPGDFTFDPNVAVTAGLQYVVYVSTFGLTNNPDGTNGLALSQTATPGIDYIVENLLGGPNSPSWFDIYDYDPSNIALTAHFTTPSLCNADHPLACGGPGAPEPAAWALMILGFGAAGASLRLRRRVAAAA
ncbi:MAG: PEPxxWA-CTERM sorting domain-containing protein [Proteobacteria bacterium]|nr:PEPxxWA-CTERM sorting domain-containing protein [Pseudomonadota bacterium]